MTDIKALKQRAKLPARQAGGTTVAEFFAANKQSIEAVLPRHINADRMLKVALGAIRQVPKLMECTVESLFGAVIQCAQLGLEPNTPMGFAHLIPYQNRKANRTDVQVIIGYRGLIDLARRSGQIVSIAAHAVYDRDDFEFAYGLDEQLVHRPAMGERGEILAFYAVAKLVGGGHAFEVMSRADVDRIKASTQSRGEYGPWKTNYEEMGRKTVTRRLFKYLPTSIEVAVASTLDQMADENEPQNLQAALSGEWSVVVENDSPAEESEGSVLVEQEVDAKPADEPAKQPVVEQSAVDVEKKWPAEIVDKETGERTWTDSAGEFYDSSIHGWSAREGHPSVTQAGRFRAARGTKGGSKGATKVVVEEMKENEAVDVDVPGDDEDNPWGME